MSKNTEKPYSKFIQIDNNLIETIKQENTDIKRIDKIDKDRYTTDTNNITNSNDNSEDNNMDKKLRYMDKDNISDICDKHGYECNELQSLNGVTDTQYQLNQPNNSINIDINSFKY